MSPASVSKVVSLDEAVALVQPGSTLATSGFVGIGTPDGLLEALARAYQTHGRPGELTLVFAAGQGDGKTRGLNRLAVPGLLKRVVGGHWGLIPRVGALALAGEIEAYNLPQGCISHLYRDIAAGKPGTLSRVGLGTFVDPRNGGGKVNARTTEELVELIEIHGEEWLLYRTFPIDVVFLRGTTADPDGNVSMEREALTLDNLAMAMAAKNSGGVVIVQVERLAQAGSLPPQDVKIPGALVDCVAVAPAEYHAPDLRHGLQPGLLRRAARPAGDVPRPAASTAGRSSAAGRRPSSSPGTLINLGIGMPESVAGVAQEEGLLPLLTLTAEPGVIGGLPASGLNFGAAVNNRGADRPEPAVRLLRRRWARPGLPGHGPGGRRGERQRQPLREDLRRVRRVHQHQPERPEGGVRRDVHLWWPERWRSARGGCGSCRRAGAGSSSPRWSRSPSAASAPGSSATRRWSSPSARCSG